MSKQTKKVTLDSLSAKVDEIASTMEAGFKRTNAKMDAGFNKVNEDIESLAKMTAKGFENTATKAAILEQGQEDIKLRLGQCGL